LTVSGLPAGFRVEFDPTLRRLGPDRLVGGVPTRTLRLSGRGVEALAELDGGPIRSPAAGTLARRLSDAGLAHPRPPVLVDDPDLVVIVPVRDRSGSLDRCLSALGKRYPVTVVDDGSMDPAAIARVAASHGAAVVRRSANGGPAAARNAGLAATASELVAFVDSDTLPDAETLTALAAHLADPEVVAAAPRIVGASGRTAVGRYALGRSALDCGPRPGRVAPLGRVPFVPTTALVVRRAALGTGFDERLRFGEDVDLIWRLGATSGCVRYDPGLLVPHTEPQTWRALLARRHRYGTSAAPLALRHPGALLPLLVEPWTAGAVGALLLRHPAVALALLAGGLVEEILMRRQTGLPVRGSPAAVLNRAQLTWRSVGGYAIKFLSPVVVPVLLCRRGAAVPALLLAEPVAHWCSRRATATDPVTHVVGHLAEDVAYGSGVLLGCVRARTAAPLLPRLRRVRARLRS
jgi:mycofactocin system glycosyltransferase